MLRLNPGRYPVDQLPEVAIVIPCYNESEFMKDAIESVVAQTYPKIDCVIVDDGSPDDTAIVVQALIECHPERKLRLLSQENAGLALARTNGVRETQAPLVLPLDQDDIIVPQTVEHMVHYFLEHPETMVLTPNGRHFEQSLAKITTGVFELSSMLKQNNLVYASMYRREVFDSVDGYNPNLVYGCEDWDFFIAAKKRGFEFRHLEEDLFCYRRHGTSMIDTAVEHFLAVRSRITLNHPELFTEIDVELARCVIDLGDRKPDLNFYLRVVMMLVAINQEQDCIPYCDKLIDEGRIMLSDEVLASVHYFKGIGLIAQQEFANAAHALRVSLDKNPCNAVCLRAYGTALFKSNQHAPALTALEDALELEPGNDEIIFTMAVIRDRTRPKGKRSEFMTEVAGIAPERLRQLYLERHA